MNEAIDVIALCKQQNAKGQQQLYQLYSRLVMGVCVRYCNRSDADDMFQEVFIKIFQNIDQYRGDGAIEGWIRRISVNACLQHLKMNKMNMPRFTAEASVYQTRGHYRLAKGWAGGIVVPMAQGVVPQLRNTDLSGASCGKAPIFGNVICVECTTGPFPTCKTYVCDKDGNNCKETVRINTQLRTASRAPDIRRL